MGFPVRPPRRNHTGQFMHVNLTAGVVTATATVEDGKIVSKKLSAELVPMDGVAPDKDYLEYLRPEYEAVKAFTVKEVGRLKVDIATLDAMKGRAAYTDLLHTLQLSCGSAEISFAAPKRLSWMQQLTNCAI